MSPGLGATAQCSMRPEAVPSEVASLSEKQVANLVARAALAGYELVLLGDGTFIASRWNMFRSLDHAAAVETFLRRVGAPIA